jgi:hypothetical protein
VSNRDIRRVMLACLGLLVVAALLWFPRLGPRPELVATITVQMQERDEVPPMRFETGWNYWIEVDHAGTARWWREPR